jgi:hypothetical protein
MGTDPHICQKSRLSPDGIQAWHGASENWDAYNTDRTWQVLDAVMDVANFHRKSAWADQEYGCGLTAAPVRSSPVLVQGLVFAIAHVLTSCLADSGA